MAKNSFPRLSCGTKLFREFILICGLAIFCILRELILAIRTDWFSCWELISAIFRKSRTKSLIIFSVLLSRCNKIINNYIFSNNTTAYIK